MSMKPELETDSLVERLKQTEANLALFEQERMRRENSRDRQAEEQLMSMLSGDSGSDADFPAELDDVLPIRRKPSTGRPRRGDKQRLARHVIATLYDEGDEFQMSEAGGFNDAVEYVEGTLTNSQRTGFSSVFDKFREDGLLERVKYGTYRRTGSDDKFIEGDDEEIVPAHLQG